MRKEIHIFFIILSILLILNTSLAGQQIKTEGVTVPPPSKHLVSDVNFGKIPLYFVTNKGQVNEKVAFYAKTSRYTLWVTKEGLVFDSLHKQPGETAKGADTVEPGKALFDRDVSWLVFHNANKNPVITAVDMTKHRMNYFIGNNQENWRRNIRTSKAILYKEIYKNIDLKVYGIEKQIEYDWIVKPGGKVTDIVFKYKKVKGTAIAENGDLLINTVFGKLVHKSPVSFQFIDGEKVPVTVRFRKIKPDTYGFTAIDYDKSRDLIIDPYVLAYSTYFGGNQDDCIFRITVDDDGFAYLTGRTKSLDFPHPTGESFTCPQEAGFVSKLSPSGRELIYTTFISSAHPWGIVVDQSGYVYVTGYAYNGLPTVYAYQSGYGGNYDAFVTKLSPDGANLVFSTYLGTGGSDAGHDIAIDQAGNIYIAGSTDSTNFPVTPNAFQTSLSGLRDIFVTKILSDGSSLLYSTYFGGSKSEHVYGIEVDNTGAAYIAGFTYSTNLPVSTTAFQRYSASGSTKEDGFVSKLSAAGNALVYSSYIGGNAYDRVYDIAIDNNGNAYICGLTTSDDFPTTPNAFRTWKGVGANDFTSKISVDGSSLVYSTFSPGNAHRIAVNSNNEAAIIGVIGTETLNYYPYDTIQREQRGALDYHITQFTADGSNLVFSTYLGGSDRDSLGTGLYPFEGDITFDSNDDIYVTGPTPSTDFPLRNPYQDTYKGESDSFVTKITYSDLAPFLTVTVPNGGEILELNEATTIRWDYQGIDVGDTIDIFLLKGGSVLGTIAEDVSISTLSYSWYAGQFYGNIAAPGHDYRIRIRTSDSAYSDDSNNDFWIENPGITVLSPNGGESWQQNTPHTITWDYAFLDGSELIRLVLMKDNGTIGTIVENLRLDARSYDWTVGDYTGGTAAPGTGYQILIETMSGLYSDQSDAAFTIGEPPTPVLTLTYPSGLEHWITGETYKIRWESENMTGNVVIEVWKNDTLLEQIGTPAVGDGTFEWLVPGTYTTGSDYQIRISQGSVESMSPGYFTISDQPAFVNHPDFNNDDKTDILWRDTITGQNGTWMMNGTTFLQHSWLAYETDTDEILAGSADFNGDGNSDLVWRNRVTGVNTVWYMNGTTRTGTATLPFLSVTSQEWEIAALVDVNGDDHPDILWSSRPTRQNGVWFMNGITRTSIVFLPNSASPDWRIAGAADFNSDSHPDILWRNTTTGQNAIWYMNGTTRTGVVFTNSLGIEWVFAGLGDMNRDGKPDIIIRHKTNGENMFWLMNNATRLEQLSFKYCGGAEWEIRN